MTTTDAVLVVVAAGFAFAGYRRGLVVSVLAFTGFLVGGLVGIRLAPRVVGDWTPGPAQTLAAIGLLLLGALLGRVLGGVLGEIGRGRLTWRPVKLLDAGLGALVGVLTLLVLAWYAGLVLRQVPIPAVSRAVRDSQLIGAVDAVMPPAARGLLGSARRLLDANEFPPVFGGLSRERIRAVDPPDAAAIGATAVRAARESVVKIHGTAFACGRGVEGSGFVFAPERVMTNAHVVAGVRAPRVQLGGIGRSVVAQVVAYDPRRDLAVLYVPGLRATPLRFGADARGGAAAVVAGFPRDGPLRLSPARVREEIRASGPDIYERRQVTREVYSLYADVQPGNSGGPLLRPDATVYGVVFAKSLDDDHTGYALTADEAAPVARAGRAATASVPTGDCTG